MTDKLPGVPDELERNVRQYLEPAAMDWLAEIPALIRRFAREWSLQVGPPFGELSLSYVAPAVRADGESCVLKLAWPHTEIASEIETLSFWNGDGSVRALPADSGAGALLLERISPASKLSALAEVNDDEATRIAARLMGRIWREPPATDGTRFIELTRWFRSLLQRDHTGGNDPVPHSLLERSQELTRDLLTGTERRVLLHGDFHHFNVLSSERSGWLVIDPKGLVGDPAFDVAAFLRNPQLLPPPLLRRRLDILVSELGLARKRIVDWCFVEGVLNALWSLEQDDGEFDTRLAWAQLLPDL